MEAPFELRDSWNMSVSTGKLKEPQGSQGLEGSFQLRDSIAKWGWGSSTGPRSRLSATSCSPPGRSKTSGVAEDRGRA